MVKVPEDFKPLFRTSPFLEANGPFYYRKDSKEGLIIGLRIEEKHTNTRFWK